MTGCDAIKLRTGHGAARGFCSCYGGLSQAKTTLAEVLLFGRCQKLTEAEVDDWLQQRALGKIDRIGDATNAAVSGIANVRPDITVAEFAAAIAHIHDYIEAGDTYQVNYTYRLHFDVYGTPFLYPYIGNCESASPSPTAH